MRARVSRKWYLVVIVLLYIGLLASFSLNITLLMRKAVPVSQIKSSVQDPGESKRVDIRNFINFHQVTFLLLHLLLISRGGQKRTRSSGLPTPLPVWSQVCIMMAVNPIPILIL